MRKLPITSLLSVTKTIRALASLAELGVLAVKGKAGGKLTP
jgi:hypothetical protein